jgi:hypothetical protein
MGQISTEQTNPEEPDYFPPFIRKKLVTAGLIKFVYANSIPEQRESGDFINQDPEQVFLPSKEFLKRAYLAKKGQNSLVSQDGTITVRPSGGLYDGVDLSIRELLLERIVYRGLTMIEEVKDGNSFFNLTATGGTGGGGGMPPEEIIELIIQKVREEVDKLGVELEAQIEKDFRDLKEE